jgi:hypothetical protein
MQQHLVASELPWPAWWLSFTQLLLVQGIHSLLPPVGHLLACISVDCSLWLCDTSAHSETPQAPSCS